MKNLENVEQDLYSKKLEKKKKKKEKIIIISSFDHNGTMKNVMVVNTNKLKNNTFEISSIQRK